MPSLPAVFPATPGNQNVTVAAGQTTTLSPGNFGALMVVVGPEGGVTDEELAVFESAGAKAAQLGAPVLRTSTAGAAACAALSILLRRW